VTAHFRIVTPNCTAFPGWLTRSAKVACSAVHGHLRRDECAIKGFEYGETAGFGWINGRSPQIKP
jgi:hypothetical protein